MKDLEAQTLLIATDIIENLPKEMLANLDKKAEIEKLKKREIVSLVAYLQRMGTDIKNLPQPKTK